MGKACTGGPTPVDIFGGDTGHSDTQMAAILDHVLKHILAPDKSGLCAIATQGGSFQTFALLLFPKRSTEAFDTHPGHVVVSGDDDSVSRFILPLKAEFNNNLKDGVAFRVSQSKQGGGVRVGFVEAEQIKTGTNSYHTLADNDLTWVPIQAIQSLSEVKNTSGFQMAAHVKEAIKQSQFMKERKCTSASLINAFCSAGKFGANTRHAWTLAEV